jgi:mxaJ protein
MSHGDRAGSRGAAEHIDQGGRKADRFSRAEAATRGASPPRRAHALDGAVAAALCLCAAACTQPGTATQSAQAETAAAQFRVCADPNNLPFSNRREEGFENRIATLFAEELNAELHYTWWPQWRTFLRNTLRAGECDVVMGVPSSFELVLPTRPYYRSTYVFLYRADAPFEIRSLDDDILRELRIGVHLIGDDYTNTPPVHALSNRGITGLKGYMIYGDDVSKENPPARLVEAVAAGDVDVAIVWGPFAGYFAPRQPVELQLVPVQPQIDLPFLPMVFDISLGVRRGDSTRVRQLEEIMERRRDEIRAIIEEYGIPEVRRGGRSRS